MKSKIAILLLVLVAWMGGSQYVWLCLVKNHCGSVNLPFADGLRSTIGTRPEPAGGEQVSAADTQLPAAVTQSDDSGRQELADFATPTDPPNQPALTPASPGSRAPAQAAPQPGFPQSEPEPLQLSLDGVVALEFEQPVRFGAGDWRLGDGGIVAARLAGWLKSNRHTDLTVIGQYRSNETNLSDWSNLGLARAHELIGQLATAGIAGSRLEAQSEQVNDSAGLRLEGTDYSLLFSPLQVYFPINSTELAVTDELRQFATLARVYLNRHPAAMVRVVGHTDEGGGLQNNYQLGLARARQVAGLLRSIGLSPARLETDSAGESQPIAVNDRNENRALNRRVELTLTSR